MFIRIFFEHFLKIEIIIIKQIWLEKITGEKQIHLLPWTNAFSLTRSISGLLKFNFYKRLIQ